MYVVLTKSALLSILLASAEAFRKESFLVLLGTKIKDHYIVEHAIPMQNAKRKSTKVETDQRAWGRIQAIANCLFNNVSMFGDCHSHTEPYHPDAKTVYLLSPSEDDKKSAKENEVYIIVSIKTKKRRVRWQRTRRGTVLGTLGKYRFELAAYVSTENGKLKNVPLSCPSAYRLQDNGA